VRRPSAAGARSSTTGGHLLQGDDGRRETRHPGGIAARDAKGYVTHSGAWSTASVLESPADMTEPTIVARVLTVAGVRTRALEVAGDGPPIVLLHGFTDSADSWRPVLHELAGMRRRAVAVDMPGAGRAPALGRPALVALDRFAEGVVDHYAAGSRVVLVGNSLGGLVTLRAAQRAELPLLAIAGLGPAGLAYHARLEMLVPVYRRLHHLLRLADRLPVPPPILRYAAAALYHHGLGARRADPSLARMYGSHLGGMRDVGRLRADMLALSDEAAADPVLLETIRVPVLLIWGLRDRLVSLAGAPALLDAVPVSRLVVFADCGHCPQIQRPGDVARLVAGLPASAARPEQNIEKRRVS
jgi:pimeloyl-ACP methyl ester carboxylesterase